MSSNYSEDTSTLYIESFSNFLSQSLIEFLICGIMRDPVLFPEPGLATALYKETWN